MFPRRGSPWKNLLKPPVAGKGESNLVLPPAEVLRVVALPEEHADVGSLILEGVDKVDQIGLDPAAIAVLLVICDKCNLHPDLILKPVCTHL